MDTDFNYDLDESRIQILGHISRSTALLERERGIKPFVRKGKYPSLHPYTECLKMLFFTQVKLFP